MHKLTPSHLGRTDRIAATAVESRVTDNEKVC